MQAKRLLYTIAMSITIAVFVSGLYEVLRPYVEGKSAQAAMWMFYEWAGWWWWGIAVGLSILGLYYMFTLSAPKTRWGTFTRVPLLAGFICYCLSWGNNALGPLGGMLIILGTVMVLRQLSVACAVERKSKWQPTSATFSQRMHSILIEDR